MNWKFQRAAMSHHNGKQKFNKHRKFQDKKQFQFKKKPSKFQKIESNVSSLKSQYENYNSKRVQSFDDLPLSKETLKGLQDTGYTKPTEIQKESIVLALRGLDILGNSNLKQIISDR